jgi:hypothetical protein
MATPFNLLVPNLTCMNDITHQSSQDNRNRNFATDTIRFQGLLYRTCRAGSPDSHSSPSALVKHSLCTWTWTALVQGAELQVARGPSLERARGRGHTRHSRTALTAVIEAETAQISIGIPRNQQHNSVVRGTSSFLSALCYSRKAQTHGREPPVACIQRELSVD